MYLTAASIMLYIPLKMSYSILLRHLDSDASDTNKMLVGNSKSSNNKGNSVIKSKNRQMTQVTTAAVTNA